MREIARLSGRVESFPIRYETFVTLLKFGRDSAIERERERERERDLKSTRIECRREEKNFEKRRGALRNGVLGTALVSHPPTSRQGHRMHHYHCNSRVHTCTRVRALIYPEVISVSPAVCLSLPPSLSASLGDIRSLWHTRSLSLSPTGLHTLALKLAFPLRSTLSRRTRSNGLHALHGHACTEPRFDACMHLR